MGFVYGTGNGGFCGPGDDDDVSLSKREVRRGLDADNNNPWKRLDRDMRDRSQSSGNSGSKSRFHRTSGNDACDMSSPLCWICGRDVRKHKVWCLGLEDSLANEYSKRGSP